jgi:hypothetical protein
MASEEGKELRLEWTSDVTDREGFDAGEGGPHPCRPALSRVALDQFRQGQLVVEPQKFDLPDGDLDIIDRRGGREVENGARHRRHRNPFMDRHLVFGQKGEVATNGPRASAFAPQRHVHDFARTTPDSPKRGGRAMAEDRLVTAREHTSHPPSLLRNDLVPNGVDTRVNSVNSSEPQTAIDRVLAQPKPTELSTTNHPILLLSDLGNPPIPWSSLR